LSINVVFIIYITLLDFAYPFLINLLDRRT